MRAFPSLRFLNGSLITDGDVESSYKSFKQERAERRKATSLMFTNIASQVAHDTGPMNFALKTTSEKIRADQINERRREKLAETRKEARRKLRNIIRYGIIDGEEQNEETMNSEKEFTMSGGYSGSDFRQLASRKRPYSSLSTRSARSQSNFGASRDRNYDMLDGSDVSTKVIGEEEMKEKENYLEQGENMKSSKINSFSSIPKTEKYSQEQNPNMDELRMSDLETGKNSRPISSSPPSKRNNAQSYTFLDYDDALVAISKVTPSVGLGFVSPSPEVPSRTPSPEPINGKTQVEIAAIDLDHARQETLKSAIERSKRIKKTSKLGLVQNPLLKTTLGISTQQALRQALISKSDPHTRMLGESVGPLYIAKKNSDIPALKKALLGENNKGTSLHERLERNAILLKAGEEVKVPPEVESLPFHRKTLSSFEKVRPKSSGDGGKYDFRPDMLLLLQDEHNRQRRENNNVLNRLRKLSRAIVPSHGPNPVTGAKVSVLDKLAGITKKLPPSSEQVLNDFDARYEDFETKFTVEEAEEAAHIKDNPKLMSMMILNNQKLLEEQARKKAYDEHRRRLNILYSSKLRGYLDPKLSPEMAAYKAEIRRSKRLKRQIDDEKSAKRKVTFGDSRTHYGIETIEDAVDGLNGSNISVEDLMRNSVAIIQNVNQDVNDLRHYDKIFMKKEKDFDNRRQNILHQTRNFVNSLTRADSVRALRRRTSPGSLCLYSEKELLDNPLTARLSEKIDDYVELRCRSALR